MLGLKLLHTTLDDIVLPEIDVHDPSVRLDHDPRSYLPRSNLQSTHDQNSCLGHDLLLITWVWIVLSTIPFDDRMGYCDLELISSFKGQVTVHAKIVSKFYRFLYFSWIRIMFTYLLSIQRCVMTLNLGHVYRSSNKNQGVFVKHYSMLLAATKSKKLFLASRSKSRSQGHWPWCHLKGHH